MTHRDTYEALLRSFVPMPTLQYLVRMAERSKALRSGRSPLLWAWVRIPLLTRPFRGDINFQQEIFWKRYQETAGDHLRKVSLYSSLKQDGRTRTLYEVSDSNCILNWVLRHPPPFAKHHLTGGTWPHGVKNHWCIKCLSALQTSSKKYCLPDGESNPGLPRDRRGYLPLYYRGLTTIAIR